MNCWVSGLGLPLYRIVSSSTYLGLSTMDVGVSISELGHQYKLGLQKFKYRSYGSFNHKCGSFNQGIGVGQWGSGACQHPNRLNNQSLLPSTICIPPLMRGFFYMSLLSHDPVLRVSFIVLI